MQNNRCSECIFYLAGLKCKAFPDGIIQEILTGKDNHLKPIRQGNDIVFEPIDKKK